MSRKNIQDEVGPLTSFTREAVRGATRQTRWYVTAATAVMVAVVLILAVIQAPNLAFILLGVGYVAMLAAGSAVSSNRKRAPRKS